MASAPPPRALSLHGHARLLDEHDRMLFQYSHPAGADTERPAFEEGSQGVSASLPEQVQRESQAVHLDQRARQIAANHRSDPTVSGHPSQTAEAGKGTGK